MKGGGGQRCFGSASHTYGRMTDGGKRRGGASGDQGGRRPRVGWVGPMAKTSWAGAKIFQGKWSGIQIEFGLKW
jgi:hypothetical protein